MKFSETKLPGVILVEPEIYGDDRGFLFESYQQARYKEGGVDALFVQDNHSSSAQSVLRGLHAQRTQPQAKLVRCIEGTIFDVAVDIRRGSPTFLNWMGVELNAQNHHQLFIPEGFAHGFCVLSKRAQVEYKCNDYYAPEDAISVRWNDPEIGIQWPIEEPLLSAKDQEAPTSSELGELLPIYDRVTP